MRRRLSLLTVGLALFTALVALPAPVSGSEQANAAINGLATKVVSPEYPEEARQRRLAGSGILQGKVNFQTGEVISVRMLKSTGHKILDDAALRAFRQWRFKPRIIREFRTPINYTLPDSV